MGSKILAALARDARFEIGAELGRSAGTVVYLVYDLIDGTERALKLWEGRRGEGPAILKRLARELRILSRLDHPALIGISRRGLAHGRPYLVMDLAPGGSTAGWMRAHGPMPVGAALRVVAQAAEGVEAAHQVGLVHRHLKPQNILMTERGAVVGDFATASSLARPFAAPEQRRDEAPGPAADIYGLGATLYALLTASAPLDLHRAGRRGLTQLHPLVESVVLRACHPRPEARHPSAAALAEELRAIERDLLLPPSDVGAPPDPTPALWRIWEEWKAR